MELVNCFSTPDKEWEDENVTEEALLGDNHPSKPPTQPSNTVRMTLVDSSGVFRLPVSECKCPEAPPRWKQLLRVKLYPASTKRTLTAFSFRVLDHFDIDHTECKTTAMSFFKKLQRFTDDAFHDQVSVCSSLSLLLPTPHILPQDRYRELLRCSRQWADIQLRKRGGFPYDNLKDSAKRGRLALSCPACPRPGFNIPVNWKSDERG
jgi:hypothetical protein